MVGLGTEEYPGFEKLTKEQLLNREIRARLLKEHAVNKGWPLLKEPLMVLASLYVAEGYLQIDGAMVTVVGDTGPTLSIQGMYSAMSNKSAWVARPPPLDGKWIVVKDEIFDYPCLFSRLVRFFFFFSFLSFSSSFSSSLSYS
jgi:hypothetical protein